jgi:hypothetical protein
MAPGCQLGEAGTSVRRRSWAALPDIKAQWRVENLIRGWGFAGVAAGEWSAAVGIAGVSFEKERAQRIVVEDPAET